MRARLLICCLLALFLPLQAQARAGFFECANEAPAQAACAEHSAPAKKAAPHTHCSACVAVAITNTPFELDVSAAKPVPRPAPEALEAGIVPATPRPPPRNLLA